MKPLSMTARVVRSCIESQTLWTSEYHHDSTWGGQEGSRTNKNQWQSSDDACEGKHCKVVTIYHFLLSPLGFLVKDESNKSLDTWADGGERQVDQHEEEQEGPEWRDVHGYGGFRIGYECQTNWLLRNWTKLTMYMEQKILKNMIGVVDSESNYSIRRETFLIILNPN